ncbi:MAG: hypothetical protein LUD50_02625 [Clostridia bacterium]|nr:hypothetical protein [Clostridia bacterium]
MKRNDYDEGYDDEDLDFEDVDNDLEACSGVEDLIDGLTEKQVRDFLNEVACKYPEVANLITIRFGGSMSEEDVEAIIDELDNMEVRRRDDYYGNISYEYGNNICDFMRRYVSEMIAAGKFEAANEICIAVYDKIGELSESDYYDVLYDVMNDCLDYWRKIEEKCPMPDKLKILDRLQKAADDSHEYDDYCSSIQKLIDDAFSEKECLVRKLDLVNDSITRYKPDSTMPEGVRDSTLARTVIKKLNLMTRIGCAQAEIDAVVMSNWTIPEVRFWHAESLHARGQTDEAIQILSKSRGMLYAGRYWTAMVTRKLADYYRELGKPNDCKRELKHYLLEIELNSCSWDYLPDCMRQLKDLCEPDEWASCREKLLERCKTYTSLEFSILNDEGLYERLMDALLEDGTVSDVDKNEDKLKPLFPERLKTYYADYIVRLAPKTSNRGEYAALMPYLQKVASYPGGQELAKEIASRWRTDFHRKRAFMDELQKAGF